MSHEDELIKQLEVSPESEILGGYNDGGLFWGHSIMVSGNLTDGPADAGIHG